MLLVTIVNIIVYRIKMYVSTTCYRLIWKKQTLAVVHAYKRDILNLNITLSSLD